MAHKPYVPRVDLKDPKNRRILELAKQVREEVKRRHGTDLNYEQRRDAAAAVMGEALWTDEEQELQESVTEDDEVDIAGNRYRRLEQRSSAVYFGRWGSHQVREALYRAVGVRNGATIKPIESRVGMIARRMTPDLARTVGELSGIGNSREVEAIMRAVGLVPPSRAVLEKRTHVMAGELAADVEHFEEQARRVEPTSGEVASVSCGMDRMAVRMSEPHSDPDNAVPPRRSAPL